MSLTPALILREGDRDRLPDLARLPSVPSGRAVLMLVLWAGAFGRVDLYLAERSHWTGR
jgi:hypothetical protein